MLKLLLALNVIVFAALLTPAQARASDDDVKKCCRQSVHGFGHCCLDCGIQCLLTGSDACTTNKDCTSSPELN